MSEIGRFRSFDGVELAWHALGQGRPVVLLHGFLSSAKANWFAPGIAQALADAGFQVIAPDCRGHGASAAPKARSAWPPDVMSADVEALIAHLALTDYDLAGYSMGGRTAARVMVRGARPRRCVLGGMGDAGIMHDGPRAELFKDALLNGEAATDPAFGRAFTARLASQGLRRDAMLGVLASFAPTTEAQLAAIAVPTLAILGLDDHDNGSVDALAAIMPTCTPLRLPGDHGAVVSTPAFRDALVGFLT